MAEDPNNVSVSVSNRIVYYLLTSNICVLPFGRYRCRQLRAIDV